MAPEHKFATAARLCQEVLAGFAEGNLPLTSAPEVLHDALIILASKEIKVRWPFQASLLRPLDGVSLSFEHHACPIFIGPESLSCTTREMIC